MKEMGFFCCVKYFTILFSCFYWILGSSIVIGSIWILTDPMFSLMFTKSGEFFYVLLYLLLFSGCFVLLSAWFACYGILKQSACILGVFIITLILIMCSEIAAGTWIIFNNDRFNDIIRASVKHSIQEEYGEISTTTVTFDVIQKHLKCCGADGPGDWIASRYNNVERQDIVNIAFSSLKVFFNVPESCCNQTISELNCEIVRKHRLDGVFHKGIYEQGCVGKLAELTSSHSEIFLGLLIGATLFEIVAFVFALCFCCSLLKNTSKNKDFSSS